MKIKKCKYEVEYRTQAGDCHSWEGYAEDEGDAITEAINQSYEGLCNDHNFHSTISVDCYDTDYILEEE